LFNNVDGGEKTRMRRFFSSFASRLCHSKKTVLLILTVAAITLIISTVISIWLTRYDNLRVPSLGTIHAVGVKAYWDTSLENETKEIQWGTIYPGSSNNVTIYLQSTSNIQAILELRTANWTFLNSTDMIVSGPSDSTQYINLTWNYNNATVSSGETVQVTLTLSADNSSNFISFLIDKDVRYFSFDMIILASEEH
jgi:hypothetical protein